MTTTELPGLSRDNSKASRRRRLLRRLGIAFIVVAVLFYGGLGFLFSSKIHNDAFVLDAPGEPDYEVEVLAVEGDTIRLSLASDNHHLTEPGVRGVSWPGGYGQVDAIIPGSGEGVVRVYVPIAGTPEPGTLLDIDGFGFQGDPLAAHNLQYETLTYQSDIGDTPAWYIPGIENSWVILVHGKSAPLRETLRALPTLARAGHHILVIEYRNDVDAPIDESGEYRYGLTEWKDVESAVTHAGDQGAERIALMGFSMGGAIVTSYMVNSPTADRVDALVLDSPMLDFAATVDLGARHSSIPIVGLPVPQSLTNVAKLLAGWRFDIDWDAMDYVDRVEGLDVPMLVFHGTDDKRVPLETSRALAEALPGRVQLEEFEDAGHVLSWNIDPARYEGALAQFLDVHLG